MNYLTDAPRLLMYCALLFASDTLRPLAVIFFAILTGALALVDWQLSKPKTVALMVLPLPAILVPVDTVWAVACVSAIWLADRLLLREAKTLTLADQTEGR